MQRSGSRSLRDPIDLRRQSPALPLTHPVGKNKSISTLYVGSKNETAMPKEFLEPSGTDVAPRISFPRLLVYEFHQDDPKKCTSARLRKFRLVKGLHNLNQIPSSAIVLNPTSIKILSREDRELIEKQGLVGLDCSWNLSQEVFDRNIRGENRRLPLLLAGNPTSYGIAGRLSTAEALAAALILTGFQKEGARILSPFKWGETFLSLNHEPLEEYAIASRPNLSSIEKEYFEAKT